jgi:hypothetical protein
MHAGGEGGRVTELLRAYVDAADRGERPDLDELLRRAGPEAEALRQRVRAFEALRGLGRALREGAPAPDGADGGQPERIGRFRIVRTLGAGGLSRVFVGLDAELQREVAIKVLATQIVDPERARNWSLQEGRSLAQLQHPGVVRVHEVGEDAGLPYVAMELVDAPSLAAVLDELRARAAGHAAPADDPRVVAAADELAGIGARVRLALAIAQALAACHAAGVLHRDVKPANVLLDRGLAPRLIDFGLAHLERADGSLNQVTQVLYASPAYAAPEQVESGRTGSSALSDQFSFGVLLYELLTLQAPFARSTRTETLDAVARAAPAPPRRLDARVPADLEQICLHALERVPGERYASMRALAADLEAFLDHRAISVAAPGPLRRALLWSRRHRRDLAVAVGALVLVAAVAGGLWAADARAQRLQLDAELGTLRAQVEHIEAPGTMEAAYAAAARLRDRAAALDGQAVAALTFGRRTVAARQTLEALSQRLAALLAAAWERDRSPVRAVQQAQEEETAVAWGAALALDAQLCPDCPWNARDRQRGRAEVAEPPAGVTVRVEQHASGPMPLVSELQPMSLLRSLRIGTFRVGWHDGQGATLAEIDVTVTAGSPGRELALRTIPAALRAELVRVPQGEVRFPKNIPSARHAALLALPRYVRVRDVIAGFGLGRLADDVALGLRGSPSEAELDAPAALTCRQANWVAEQLGMRLPSPLEAIALRRLVQQPGAALEALPDGCAGELCSGRLAGAERPHLKRGPDDAPPSLIPVTDDGSFAGGPLAFRLVVTDGP